MPNLISNLLQYFTVTGISYSSSIDTFLNVCARREKICYTGTLPITSAGISYLENKTIDTTDCLTITDLSQQAIPNNIELPNEAWQTITPGSSWGGDYELNTTSYSPLITDVFSGLNNGPLFYKHIINRQNLPRVGETLSGYLINDCILDAGDLLITPNVKLTNVQLLQLTKDQKTPIGIDDLYKDMDRGIIYSNTQNKYNSPSNYSLYYIQYTVTSGLNSEYQTVYTDLLNSVPVYREAEVGEWGTRNNYKIYNRVLIHEKTFYTYGAMQGFGADVDVGYLQVTNGANFAVKENWKQPLQVLPPVSQDINSTWFVRLHNGGYYLNDYATGISKIKEWPHITKMRQYNDRAIILDDSNVKLSASCIAYLDTYKNFTSGQQPVIQVDINDASGNGIAAFTNSSFIEGKTSVNNKKYQYWTSDSPVGINSVDFINGILHIQGLKLEPTYQVIANYYWFEYEYTYKDIDFNPFNHPELIGNNVYILIDPAGGSGFITQDVNSGTYCLTSIFYFKTDCDNRIYESNYSTLTDKAFSPNKPGVWDWDGDGTEVVLYYPSKPATDNPAHWEVFDPNEIYGVPNSSFHFSTILVCISVRAPATKISTDVWDIRKRGGGIKPSLEEEAKTLNDTVGWYWDRGNWNGLPYPGQGSYIAEVPAEILIDAGGSFTGQQVRDVIDRHTVAGVYPIIRGYGIDISVSGISSPGSGELTINWTGIGR